MDLGSKASRSAAAQQGYAMAALLVAMSVMSILMGAALQTWSHMIRRENEEELIFRGQQYARAINLYQRRYANASPPSIDVLVEQRFLRKKYKDPLSPNEDGEFEYLTVSSQDAGSGRQTGIGSLIAPGRSRGAGGRASGPIIGVASKNTGESIRVYEGKSRYNEWQFIGLQQSTRGGGGAQAGPAGGRSGQPPGATVIESGPGGMGFRPRDAGRSQQDGNRGQPPPQRGGQFPNPARGR